VKNPSKKTERYETKNATANRWFKKHGSFQDIAGSMNGSQPTNQADIVTLFSSFLFSVLPSTWC
jgi:hypothetical protein